MKLLDRLIIFNLISIPCLLPEESCLGYTRFPPRSEIGATLLIDRVICQNQAAAAKIHRGNKIDIERNMRWMDNRELIFDLELSSGMIYNECTEIMETVV